MGLAAADPVATSLASPSVASLHHEVFILLGANIEPHRNLTVAVGMLAAALEVRAVSRVYQSPAVARPEQPPFLNSAVLARTEHSPAALRDEVLRPIETALGRVRTADRHAPRTIDLDIVMYDQLVTQAPLVLPDPDIERYAHVALPLADLAPDFVHPLSGHTLAEIAARFADVPHVHMVQLNLLPTGR
jgi:2-amino-4-hydroxy-6-hydroxymethyldihydropteridine diphosphokinase